MATSTVVQLLGHSAALVIGGQATILVDPGSWSARPEPEEYDAIFVTHGHPDHLDPPWVLAAGKPVWGPADVLDLLRQAGADPALLNLVTPGTACEVGDLRVEAFASTHAEIAPQIPLPSNLAYLFNGVVLHPGDSFPRLPHAERVLELLTPIAGPWCRIADAVAFVKYYPNARVLPIHHAVLNDDGLALAARVLANSLPGREIAPVD
ncbi:MAG: MBL fold metallo-hydrolase [Promicromonosporaceae bacterium]|nr:MBL fold metallo-hydrolase [Promicromonosporaceae bacterium]